jgi:hypothetical protein
LQRIPFGLDRLPRSMALDDARLRCAVVGDEPLRFNSEPLPPEVMPLAIGEHAARVAAVRQWLEDLCGDYAPLRRRFVEAYLDFIAKHLAAHRLELAERLRPYDGLYAPEDFLWSAWRPLPRGWALSRGQLLPADFVFWDGRQIIAVEVAARDTERQRALRASGIAVCRIAPAMIDQLSEALPNSFLRFWEGQMLPSSAFRRAVPSAVLGASRPLSRP